MLRNQSLLLAGRAAAGKPARGMADWLCLAASPVFAVMALLTQIDGQPDMLCSAMGASPLGGMVPMYLLMSLFHSSPWLKLIFGRHKY
ncbi:MAG TPA: hypothetical protein VHM27_12060 [Rhizomicrobium sp.]|jgi:hypothetical protein|nr:hypothetical protein [Rhizomicrobium sp.]